MMDDLLFLLWRGLVDFCAEFDLALAQSYRA
jgi:hypothetical protein